MVNLDFYKGKKVLITGHTGFKGSWLAEILKLAGANVVGYSLEAPTSPALFELANVQDGIKSIIGDIRDFDKLKKVFDEEQPEIVFHLAAQPIVRESYQNPRYTYEVNVMGTVNICECVRQSKSVKSFLNVTTDKVYKNTDEKDHPFKESEPLDGFDPYSNSKSCSELVTHSYINSFFANLDIAVSTARAGNVIGGGDFAKDRIVPDWVRSVQSGTPLVVRNKYSTRPFQHVLEPLAIYLEICEKQFSDKKYASFYNVGPNKSDCISTGNLVQKLCSLWGNGSSWEDKSEKDAPHEASYLELDNSLIKKTFGWAPHWNLNTALEKTVEWTKAYINGESVSEITKKQIKEYFGV